MAEPSERGTRWIARLTPTPGTDVDGLLRTHLGLDVWERDRDGLVVRASEGQLRQLERRRLATVKRHRTDVEYVAERQGDGKERSD